MNPLSFRTIGDAAADVAHEIKAYRHFKAAGCESVWFALPGGGRLEFTSEKQVREFFKQRYLGALESEIDWRVKV